MKQEMSEKNKPNVKQYLDNLLGEDGVKTDLKITLTKESAELAGKTLLMYGLLTGVSVTIAVHLIGFIVRKIRAPPS